MPAVFPRIKMLQTLFLVRPFRTTLPASGLGLLLTFAVAEAVRAYDPPDFKAPLFSADGIFLAEDEKSSVLEALAALACNFPNNPRVDSDLREKALALGLQLDPLHYNARMAHRELSVGATPKATGFFDSLSSVSETLWTVGTRLSSPPLDPEEKRLAPLLLELSLLIHPEPPVERLEAFALACDRKPIEWEPTTDLQRDSNRSTDRALEIFRESVDRLREKRRDSTAKAPASDDTPSTTDPRPDRPPRPSDRPVIEPVQVSLASVREVQAIDSGPVIGTVSLTLRSPGNGLEREWLQERVAAAVPFPVMPSEEEIPLTLDAIPAAAATGRAWAWPPGAIGEVRFTASTQPPGPRRLLRAQALLPTLVLLESALAKKTLSEEFVLLGDLDPTSLQPTFPGDPIATIELAGSMGRPYLLVPASIFESLVIYLQKSSRLDLLFKSELIAYPDLSGAITRLTTSGDPALVGASKVFAEVKAVSDRMTLPDLARNPAVQERLRALLLSFPDHLSAHAMLEYGTRPVTQELKLSQFVMKVDQVVAPFLPLKDNGTDTSAMVGKLEVAATQFLKLRSETPIEARDLVGAAEDLVGAAELYLQLTNKDTAIAIQRLRETREKIEAFESERVKLGIEAPTTL